MSDIAAIRPEKRKELERALKPLIESPPIVPTSFNLLIWVPEVETTTESGIVMMTDTEQKREQKGAGRGFVIAIGPTAWQEFDDGEPWAEVGDLVLFERYSGVTPPVDGLDSGFFRVMRDEAIIGVM